MSEKERKLTNYRRERRRKQRRMYQASSSLTLFRYHARRADRLLAFLSIERSSWCARLYT